MLNKKVITDILAAKMDFNFDYEKIKNEILSLRKYWVYTPPYKANLDAPNLGKIFRSDSKEYYDKIDYTLDHTKPRSGVIRRDLRGQYIFYLRNHKNNVTNDTRFSYVKTLSTEGWQWIKEFETNLSYTINCIESIGYEHIGCIRVFITENTFFPTHRDTISGDKENPQISHDYERCLGLSLIPDTGGVPMSIQSFKDNEIYNVHGNAMLFNDSAFHGVKYTPGIRITIRIFGKIDFQKFEKHIDSSQAFYIK